MNVSLSTLALLFPCLALFVACNSLSTQTEPSIQDEAPTEASPPPVQISDYVVDIFEDSKGHLWFGSIDRGVARYDGEQLTYLTEADGLPGNRVTSINEDEAGNY